MPKATTEKELLCVHNKKVYTKHVCEVMVGSILHSFRTKYDEILNTPNRRKGILESFQDALAEVANWNREKIATEFAAMIEKSKCSYFSDLLKATLLVYVKVELNGVQTLPNIKLVVPTAEHFFHMCCIECARELWKVPQLLYHGGRTINRQTALIACEDMFHKAIAATLRKSLPLEEIIKYTLKEAAKPTAAVEEESETESEHESESESDESSTADEEPLPEPLEEPEPESELEPVDEPLPVPVDEPVQVPVDEPVDEPLPVPVDEPLQEPEPVPEPVLSAEENPVDVTEPEPEPEPEKDVKIIVDEPPTPKDDGEYKVEKLSDRFF